MVTAARSTSNRSPDVVVLGSGLVSSVTAALLAASDVEVLVIDHSSHPKFTIGESMVPYSTAIWNGLAVQYGVPELSPHVVREELAASVGVKESFGYVHHQPGRAAETANLLQHVNPARSEMHLFRQDVDAHLVRGAMRRGVQYRFDSSVGLIDVGSDRIRLHLTDGVSLSCRYLIDGTGYRSLLAERFGLRTPSPTLRTHSASCFTHMIDVRPFDSIHGAGWHGMDHQFHDGTLHHVFPGGWLWVIPFNNTELSHNPLVSVGLQLDCRGRDPVAAPTEEDVADLIKSFPDVQRQFADAIVVRPWVSTRRLQYSSTSAVGPRFCLLPHAYGFVDPLYSRGLCFGFDGVKALVPLILDSLAEDDFSPKRFEPLNGLYEKLLRHHDDLVYGSYLSFGDPRLWRQWYEFWNLSTVAGEGPLIKAASEAVRTADFDSFQQWDHKGTMGGHDDRLAQAISVLEATDSGSLAVEPAADLIQLLAAQSWDDSQRCE